MFFYWVFHIELDLKTRIVYLSNFHTIYCANMFFNSFPCFLFVFITGTIPFVILRYCFDVLSFLFAYKYELPFLFIHYFLLFFFFGFFLSETSLLLSFYLVFNLFSLLFVILVNLTNIFIGFKMIEWLIRGCGLFEALLISLKMA